MVTTVFFDLGDTLGRPVLSPPPIHLAGFEAFDFAAPVLAGLAGRGLRLGVISNTGDDDGPAVDAILAAAGLLGFFADGLRIYSRDVGLRKDSPAIFELAADRAGTPPSACMFVGENPEERAFAQAAGMTTAPSALSAGETLIPQPEI
jgi:FMN phosphatase YigB (HAD superfamily)